MPLGKSSIATKDNLICLSTNMHQSKFTFVYHATVDQDLIVANWMYAMEWNGDNLFGQIGNMKLMRKNASVFTDFADPRTTAFDPIIFE